MLPFGTGEIAVRSLSAICGILSIFIIYQIGCQLFNRKVGLISSFLLAISPFHIHFSQEARSYSLLLLLTLLSFFLFIKVLRVDNANKSHFVYYAIANILLIYTHYFGLFIVTSQILYFILYWNKHREIRNNFLYAQLATGIAFLPWLPLFVGFSIPLSKGGSQPSVSSIIATLKVYSGGQNFLLLTFFFLGLLGLFSIKGLSNKWSFEKPLQAVKQFSSKISVERESILLLIWCAFLIVIPWLISQIPSRQAVIYNTRRTISALPAFYILVANGISTFTRRKSLYPLFIAILIMIAGFSYPGLQHYYTYYQKAQWREAANFVELNSRVDSDVIIICKPWRKVPFNYYYKGNLPEFGIGKNVEDSQELTTFVDDAVRERARLWLILSHDARSAPIHWYLLNRYGDQAILLEKEFYSIALILFDLPPP